MDQNQSRPSTKLKIRWRGFDELRKDVNVKACEDRGIQECG